jgi:hypothetical protein
MRVAWVTSQLSRHQDNSGKNEATAKFSLFHPLIIAKSLINLLWKAKSKSKDQENQGRYNNKTDNNNNKISQEKCKT